MKTATDQAIAAAVAPRSLELIVLPTEKCNFRCTYCYEDFEIGRMKPAVVSGLKNLISTRCRDLQTLKLVWFGGEPLLERDLMRDIARHAIEQCELTGCEVQPGEVTTNGFLLTEATLRELVGLKTRLFQVSLDGDEDAHELTRRHIAGKPTFAQIMEHLYAAKSTDLDFRILLRLHMKPDNLESLLRLAGRLRTDFLPDKRFSVLLKPIGNWGGPNAGKFATLGKDDAAAAKQAIQNTLYGEIRPGTLTPAPEPLPYVCYASSPSSLVIRPDGRVAKCTTAFNDPLNDVGTLRDDGMIEFRNDALRFWFSGLFSKDKSQLACPYHSVPKPAASQLAPVRLVKRSELLLP